MPRLLRSEHRFSWWHQGVMLFDRDYEWSEGFGEYIEAGSGEWLDQSRSGGVTCVSPGRAVFDSEDAPLTVEVHDTEPSIEPEAESVGDFDLRGLSGYLVLEESGGGWQMARSVERLRRDGTRGASLQRARRADATSRPLPPAALAGVRAGARHPAA